LKIEVFNSIFLVLENFLFRRHKLMRAARQAGKPQQGVRFPYRRAKEILLMTPQHFSSPSSSIPLIYLQRSSGLIRELYLNL
jgi:hypothetical protein